MSDRRYSSGNPNNVLNRSNTSHLGERRVVESINNTRLFSPINNYSDISYDVTRRVERSNSNNNLQQVGVGYEGYSNNQQNINLNTNNTQTTSSISQLPSNLGLKLEQFLNYIRSNKENFQTLGKDVAIVIPLTVVAYYLLKLLKSHLAQANFAEMHFFNLKTINLLLLSIAVVIIIVHLINKSREVRERRYKELASNAVSQIKLYLQEHSDALMLLEETFVADFCLSNSLTSEEMRMNVLPRVKEIIRQDEMLEESLISYEGSFKSLWKLKSVCLNLQMDDNMGVQVEDDIVVDVEVEGFDQELNGDFNREDLN